MTGLVAVIMVFSIPIVAIVTGHFQTQTKLKGKFIQDELELEKLKNQNYLIETEKMRLEIEKMKLNDTFKQEKIL
ncbi:hypothetical protein [Peribacillus alkalitolerans]|uniref:hypothetical protein n=1 Tax=Peribacillus alkalitolerans TaxID=1550385 RepID=UPI0013D58C29|nr:hypothetical protein [Peribacillus alkalitolerans]